MGKIVQKLVTEDSFVNGVLVPAGHLASYDTDLLNGKEPHIHDAKGVEMAVIEMAAIGPSGPNPTAPQQIGPGTIQGPGGQYKRPGADVVAEVTLDADQRLRGRMAEGDTTEGDMAEKLRKATEETGKLRAELAAATAKNDAASNEAARLAGEGAFRAAANVGGQPAATPAGNAAEGSIADVTADLGSKDDAALDALEASEKDREKPRKGVLDAIKAERAGRTPA